MRQIWAGLLAILGFTTFAYADCYEQGVKLIELGNENKGHKVLDYCADSDFSKIQAIEEVWPFLTEMDEKIKLATDYKNIAKRLKNFGLGEKLHTQAAGRCEICVVMK